MILDEKEKPAREKLCLSLDGLDTINDLKERVEELSPIVGLFKNGSSILVVGRAITQFEKPEERLSAGLEILKDIAAYM